MNKQEAFNTAYAGVIKQGKPSATKSGGCLYRGPNRRKCGIGQLLTNKEAEGLDSRDTSSVRHLLRGGFLPNRFKSADVDFFEDLQSAHDQAADHSDFLDHFRNNMARVANHYKLKVPA
ncbi:MAG: hypothetical protein EOQ39_18685 [Mesorhizobium sp.]|uniref:hypothetical protein n=1 Tax=Mesorhizobium sp. TaxID=1871066 RepID=UPI000FE762B5|nr:hypothetical protein [Mesorhizobium sp.]RWB08802.1 MAG: hypothetical protein EOQ37_04655 [Mesorhizobium sp.]RWB13547.1 MAG: hypothetical protein EOQ39_18685 [Mesorhizobium sp.]